MAVDPEDLARDLHAPRPGPLDERVERGGWVYYVRVVKRVGDLLDAEPAQTGIALVDAPLLARWFVRRRLGRRRPDLVGVVRLGAVHTWNESAPVVVHHETLARGADPRARIAILSSAAASGEFAP